ncbi:MAG: (d)CMP kinase [Planctomycetes bacterium]|nr:(d)CMP kinase [Planctomycetota bacterium]
MHPGFPLRSAGTVVAIDGPAGSGKSTLARLLARELGFRYLDSGAMYRALTLKALREGAGVRDGSAMAALLARTDIRLETGGEGQRTLLDGEDVSAEIRTAAVTEAVAHTAAHPAVREGMVGLQRRFALQEEGGVVVEGRDIGTVVFPDAVLKFYLDASPDERARRRAAQSGGRPEEEEEAILRRDGADESRAVAPLRQARDALRIDTTGLDVGQVLARLLGPARERLALP